MNIYESESMTVVADDGIIHYIIDRNDPHTANYADKRGKTGAAVWTLKGEDIRKNKPVCTPYNEHNSVDEKLDGLKSNITLDDMGLRIDQCLGVRRPARSQYDVETDRHAVRASGSADLAVHVAGRESHVLHIHETGREMPCRGGGHRVRRMEDTVLSGGAGALHQQLLVPRVL